jgi:hypothetical protein
MARPVEIQIEDLIEKTKRYIDEIKDGQIQLHRSMIFILGNVLSAKLAKVN